jgi:hypothetical protein
MPAGSRMPTGQQQKVSDPFMRPGRPTETTDYGARAWNRARRGLGMVQAGIALLFLAVVACPVLVLAGQFGVRLPDQDPGYLKLTGLSAANEIKAGAVVIPGVLGFLMIILGRLGAASAPPESLGRGMARAAAWASVFALLGLIAVGLVGGYAAADGFIPRVVPNQDVLKPGVRLQERVERYIAPLFLAPDEPAGQIQRVGAAAFFAFILLAELWFFGALGRYAASLQHPPAAGRVNGFAILMGLLAALAAIGAVAFDLFGEPWYTDQFKPKWNDLGEKGRAMASGGVMIGVALILAVLYCRAVGGVKRAIREAYDPLPPA